jgi:WD repeat-containing protein 68
MHAGDDKRALIWDIRLPKVEAILAYEAAGPINQVCFSLIGTSCSLVQIQWASAHPDWIGICFDHQLEILRV